VVRRLESTRSNAAEAWRRREVRLRVVARPTMRACNETAELVRRLLDALEEDELDASSAQGARMPAGPMVSIGDRCRCTDPTVGD
jgi:hypothetical protein